ncbi:MFS transporter [Actinosynnema sp. NPDC047251]|uniref:Permease, MFS-type n=1 Tax=Saccharothrix espanaensis (strain ATCC 51144 / DSM 44229 / JCM 9112 / NBRC 15066 / NRRL 15764) TaxID=1179773 RepID=K0JTS5_SACES|nr:MFS transporter [Saccharothrix espanaensis]CCH31190.1 Permease, MFS-type [Saccharothrix espanaensis DSM 44229]
MHDTNRAGRREWAGLAVLAMPTLLLSMDISVLYLALPHLSADLGASANQQLWILDIYSFLLAGFLVTMGNLGDRVGRRRLLLIGAAIFAVASVVAAYSTSAEMLIATRALMGVTGATLMPSTLALISNMFHDAKQRGTAIAMWASCMMAGGALGPVVGGLLLQGFGWGAVFLMAVPVLAVLLVAGPFLLPEFRNPDPGKLDLVSVALSLAAILPVIWGVKEIARVGPEVLPLVAVVVGVVFGWLFGVRQRRLEHPLLDLGLFASRSFSAALTILLIAGATLGGIFLLVSQYVQLVETLSPAEAGLWLMPVGLSIAVGTMVGPKLGQKLSPGVAIAAGLLVSVVGFVLLMLIGESSGLPMLLAGIVILYIGAGPAIALGTNAVVGSVPPAKAGAAASVSETSNQLGVALGIAAFGAIGTAVYQGAVTVPADVTGEAREVAGESLAGATAVAQDLSGGVAEELSRAAHEAFMSALHVGAAVGGATFVVLAAVALAFLRGKSAEQRSERELADSPAE